MALRPLPRIGPSSPTGNVSMQGAANAEFEAAARLGRAVASAATEVGAQIEADQQAQDQQALAESMIARNETLSRLSIEFREPEAFREAADAAAEDAISNARPRVRRETELMWRRGIVSQEGQVRERAYNDHLRDSDQAMGLAWQNEDAFIDSRVREMGAAAWEDPDVQAIIESRTSQATYRSQHPDLTYGGEDYVNAVRDELLTRVALGVTSHEALAEYERTGSVDAARETVEQGLGSLTISNAVYDSAMSSIMSDVRARDTERRRAAEALLRANEGRINDAVSNSRRGQPPGLDIVNILGRSEQGQDLLSEMNANVEAYQLTQRYVGESAEMRAAMRAEAENMDGVARDRYEAALHAGDQLINEFRNNPVGFVMATQPDIAANLEVALDSGDPSLVQGATQDLIDAQMRAGFLPRDVHVLADGQAARMVDSMQLDLSDPAARATLVATVQNIDQTYGRFAADVFSELEEAGLNRAALHIANTRWTDDQGYMHLSQAAPLAERAATSSTRDRESLINATDTNEGRDSSTLNQVEAEVTRAIEPILASLVPFVPGADRDRQRIYDQTYDLALQAVIEGRTPRQAAELAATAYSDRYQFMGTVRVPNGVEGYLVSERIDTFMDDVSPETVTPGPAPDGQPQELTEFENRAYAEMVRQQGTWATRPDDAGIILFDHTGRQVLNAQTGEYVFIPWEDLPLSAEEQAARDTQLRALGAIGP